MKRIFLSVVLLLLLVSKCFPNDYTQDANAKATYLLDETSGNALDSTDSYTGTVNGATQGVTGQFNTAYDFETTESDNISIGDVDILDGETAWSIILWIKPESVVNNAGLTCKAYGPAHNSFDLHEIADGLVIDLAGRQGSSSFTGATKCTDIDIPTGSFSHICWIGNSTLTNHQYWKDGVQYTTSSDFGSNGAIGNTDAVFYIGRWEQGTYFDGVMDDIGIFNDTLTSTEINDIMDNGLAGTVTASPFRPMVNIF